MSKKTTKRKIVSAEKRFYSNLSELLELLDDIVKDLDNNFWENIGIKLATGYIDVRQKDYLVTKFAKSHRQWVYILNKDKEYFIKNGLTLIKTKDKQIKKVLKSAIKKILSSDTNKEVEKKFWRLLHGLVRTTIHFLYANPSNIPKRFGWSIEEVAKIWEVELGLVVYSDGKSEIKK